MPANLSWSRAGRAPAVPVFIYKESLNKPGIPAAQGSAAKIKYFRYLIL